jgi:uncharacterized protein (DUF2141 family)
MKTRSASILVLIAAFAMSFTSKEAGTLTISISNIKQSGKFYLSVHKSGDNFPDDKNIVARQVATCSGTTCVFQFSNLAYGQYAIALYQDVNGNEKLDTGTFGIPKEPFAFSNNFKPRFGGPNFEKCRFEFSKDKQNLDIELINSLF